MSVQATTTYTIDDVYSSKSDWLKAADLKKSDGTFFRPNVTIERFEIAEKDGNKQVVLFFEGKEKKLGLNKINAERISAHTGSRNPHDWTGWTIRLFVEKVQKPDGSLTDGIRVSSEWSQEPPVGAMAQAAHESHGFGAGDDKDIPF